MASEATFLVWCDFSKFGTWQEVSKLLINDAQVALSGENFLVVLVKVGLELTVDILDLN